MPVPHLPVPLWCIPLVPHCRKASSCSIPKGPSSRYEQQRGEQEQQENDILVKTLQDLAELEETGRRPADDRYLSLLKACSARKAIGFIKQVYEHIKYYRGPQIAGILGDHLVIGMVKCGSIRCALEVFKSIPQHTVYAWTALISGFTEAGQARHAFTFYKLMTADGVQPNEYTFVSLLKACGGISSLHKAQVLHAELEEKGLASNIFIESSLLSTYSKCGRLEEAEHLFCKLFQRNTVCWNAMLSAYVQQQRSDKAIWLYRQMAEEIEPCNSMTYVIALQACTILTEEEEPTGTKNNPANVAIFSICEALHAVARRKGFVATLGSVLVRVYGRCSNVWASENAFCDILPFNCDVTVWNAMIATYAENGLEQLALLLFCHMLHIGVSPDEWTYVHAICACSIMAEAEENSKDSFEPIWLDIGQALHNDVKRMGFLSQTFVGSSLLSMYKKIGIIDKAESVFGELTHSDSVSWNAMLSAYIDHGQADSAIRLYRQMMEENKRPNAQTFTIAAHACECLAVKEQLAANKNARVLVYDIGKSLHADALREGLASDVYLGNTLIAMYNKCQKLTDSECAFQGLIGQNIISWNSMLAAYVENGFEVKGFQFLLLMLQNDIRMNEATFEIIFKACSNVIYKGDPTTLHEHVPVVKSVAVKLIQALHVDLTREGFDKETSIASLLMNCYSKCEMVSDASSVFERLSQKDVFSYNAMLSVYAQNNFDEKLLGLHSKMIFTCGTDEATAVYALQACSNTGNLDGAQKVHFDIVSAGYDQSLQVSTTLIHSYGSCKSMEDAELVFCNLCDPDLVSWGACLTGYAQEGSQILSMSRFMEMRATGVQPNQVAFLSLIHSCSHSGLVWEGVECFETMYRSFNLKPDFKCYAGVVDLLWRAGDLFKVRNMLSRLPMQENMSLWAFILSIFPVTPM